MNRYVICGTHRIRNARSVHVLACASAHAPYLQSSCVSGLCRCRCSLSLSLCFALSVLCIGETGGPANSKEVRSEATHAEEETNSRVGAKAQEKAAAFVLFFVFAVSPRCPSHPRLSRDICRFVRFAPPLYPVPSSSPWCTHITLFHFFVLLLVNSWRCLFTCLVLIFSASCSPLPLVHQRRELSTRTHTHVCVHLFSMRV